MNLSIRLILGLFAVVAVAGPVQAADPPNMIVIFTDDHGWADLGSQGIQQDIRTPHLDALAAGGLRATNGYVTAPQCVPSRGGLLTGRYQNRFGLESNGQPLDGFNAQVTIAERLKAAGYATGMSGKWHLGPPQEIVQHGFDDVYCNQGGPERSWSNFDLDGKTVPGESRRDTLYHLDANSAAACAFIQRHKQEPFFFYLAYRAPHVPLDAPPKYLARFPGEMPERRRQCLAMLSAVDDGVGQVMETLRRHGLEEKTLIFFLGDNGAPLKIHKEDKPGRGAGWDGSLNAPLNGEKGMLSEGGIRVPWLAYWKGTIPGGQVYERPVISLDVAATAVALAGIETRPGDLDGVDLMPHFTGRSQAAPHDVLYWRWTAQAAIREGKWKLLVGGPRSYLFDLEADRGETLNLFDQHPEIARRLRARLREWSGELQPPGIPTQPMAKTWEDYFDFYLDGKPAATAPAATPDKSEADGWAARNASAQVKDGSLHIVSDKAGGQRPFVAFTGLKIPGPATVKLLVRNATAGKLGISWRLEGQQDFPAGQIVQRDLKASADYQQLTIPVPADGTIIHVRLLLPDGTTNLRSFEIAAEAGRRARKWSYESREPLNR